MDIRDLSKLVAEMRNAQKEFFRTKSQTALQAAKRLEAKVDHVLACLAEEQKTLWD